MEKDWPPLEDCPQYRHGLMDAALYRYPWEEDGYVFDFDRFHPPIPHEPPWFRKLVESTRGKVRPPYPELPVEENTESCPICLPFRKVRVYKPPTPLFSDPEMEKKKWMEIEKKMEMEKKEIREHPMWYMDPIPCPFHILRHFYDMVPGSSVIISPPSLVTPEELENTKKFLKELRSTRGYNVPSIPHPCLVSSCYLLPQNLDDIIYDGKTTTRDFLIEKYLHSLIDHIDFKTGKSYKLVKVLRSISTMYVRLLTFSAAASPALPQTFIATVLQRPSSPKSSLFPQIQPGSNPNILECLLLPDHDAPCETRPLDEKDIRKKSFAHIKNMMTLFLGHESESTRKRKLASGAEAGEAPHPLARKLGACEERGTDMTDDRGKDPMDTSCEVEKVNKISRPMADEVKNYPPTLHSLAFDLGQCGDQKVEHEIRDNQHWLLARSYQDLDILKRTCEKADQDLSLGPQAEVNYLSSSLFKIWNELLVAKEKAMQAETRASIAEKRESILAAQLEEVQAKLVNLEKKQNHTSRVQELMTDKDQSAAAFSYFDEANVANDFPVAERAERMTPVVETEGHQPPAL